MMEPNNRPDSEKVFPSVANPSQGTQSQSAVSSGPSQQYFQEKNGPVQPSFGNQISSYRQPAQSYSVQPQKSRGFRPVHAIVILVVLLLIGGVFVGYSLLKISPQDVVPKQESLSQEVSGPAVMSFDEAYSSGNPVNCLNISPEDIADCVEQLALDSQDISVCDTYGQLLPDTGDSGVFPLTDYSESIAACKYDYITNLLTEDDCSILPNESAAYSYDSCRSYFIVNLNGSCSSLSELEGPGSRFDCLMQKAWMFDDVSLCEEIYDDAVNPSQDECYQQVAITHDRPELCENIGLNSEDVSQSLCYYAIASFYKQPSLCDNLPEDADALNNKVDCLEASQ